MSFPDFIDTSQITPTNRLRRYNGRQTKVWECKVRIDRIRGWENNPRIDVIKRSYLDKNGCAALDDDEIFELMKDDPECRLKELRDDILKNGLREPLVLTFDGKLLDGNRRYFALRMALAKFNDTNPNRQDFLAVEAFVLDKETSLADEENVLVEENFAPSLKIEWPDYVKAQKVAELKSEGIKDEEIAQRIGWPKSKVKETHRINELKDEFEAFASVGADPSGDGVCGLGLTSSEAQALASKNFQFLNEAQKSFHQQIMTDPDFKHAFFRWLYEGKFASFAEVRVALKAFRNTEAMAALSKPGSGHGKAAKAIIDYHEQMEKDTGQIEARIRAFVQFLEKLQADEIKLLSSKSKQQLLDTIRLIQKMSDAAST